jgi:hypothetical protein
MRPALEVVDEDGDEVLRRRQLVEHRSRFGHLTVDDGAHDGGLAVEVAVQKAGAHARRLRDVGHARGVEAALGEAAVGGGEDALALGAGTLGVIAGRRRGDHSVPSPVGSSAPPSVRSFHPPPSAR